MRVYDKIILTTNFNLRLISFVVFVLCSLFSKAQAQKNIKDEPPKMIVIPDEMKEKNSNSIQKKETVPPRAIDDNTVQKKAITVLPPTHAAPPNLPPTVLTKDDSIRIEEIKRIKGKEKLNNNPKKD
jgi:hypothetical protein